MSLLSFRHSASARTGGDAQAALNALLERMRQRFYPETIPALASCWLKTLCSGHHNRAWWVQLKGGMDRELRDGRLDGLCRAVVMSARNWIDRAVLAATEAPPGSRRLEPPFRSLAPGRLIPYVCRLLNEWLPAELAFLLTEEQEAGAPDEGIPALARAKALDRLLVRERFSPETLETLLEPEMLSPKLVYPGDAEILRDVVLALLGRVSAPAPRVLPAELLGVTGDSALPPDYGDAVRHGFIERPENGADELHVPISDAAALEILRHDAVRVGSVLVTMDGRAWQAWTLLRGDGNRVVYRPGERLRIDCTADHAKLTVQWPERVSSWSGQLPPRGPFALFGREWRTASWEMDGNSTLLHLAFSRVMAVAEAPPSAAARDRLQPAGVDMAWSELEGALAESISRKTREPLEQMRRAELVPLGRSLCELAECFQSNWMLNAKNIEQHLRAALYHHASVEPVYGRAPWRILPEGVQASLAKMQIRPDMLDVLSGIFADAPLATGSRRGRPEEHSTPPSRAA